MKQLLTLIKRNENLAAVSFFFAVTVLYFTFFGNYVLYFQETQSLFIFGSDYFRSFLNKPGGLLIYTARFITQFYAAKFAGSLILALILTLPVLLLATINRRLIPGNPFSTTLILLPSFLLLLLQANYYHLMEYNLGLIMLITGLYGIIKSNVRIRRTAVIFAFPVLYYITGAYALLFVFMFIMYELSCDKGIRRYVYSVLLIAEAIIIYFVFRNIIFLEPASNILLYPLPFLENASYKAVFIVLSLYLISYPAICLLIARINLKKLSTFRLNLLTGSLISLVSLFFLFRTYNSQTSRVIELERLIFSENWDEAIQFQEEKPSRNLISQYFYNLALSEKGLLCERLFYGPQDFGTESLVLPWGDSHLGRGGYFYYAIGLMNEAHRWAYEEMVVYGIRPQNIELLVKTSLLNGDFRMAQKYTGIMKKTLLYRADAIRYEKIISDPSLLKADSELGPKVELLPEKSFFIKFNEPQTNLPLILESQPGNRKAIEYYMAGLLLTKNVEAVVANIKKLKEIGYTKIPRHIEEAAIIYYNSTGIIPDLGGLAMSMETQARFEAYFNAYKAYRTSPALNASRIEKEFSNSYWYYFHFK